MTARLDRYPTPSNILAARHAAGLTQAQAAALVHTGFRVWSQWERGLRRMHPATWELFRLKAGLTIGPP